MEIIKQKKALPFGRTVRRCGLIKILDFIRQHKRRSVLAGQHSIGFLVAGEYFFLWIKFKRAAQAIRNVTQVS